MTTPLEIIKSTYPSQYVGIISDGKITTFVDVWNGKQYNGGAFDVSLLPALDSMSTITLAQWTLLATPSMSGILNVFVNGTDIQYPNRFYCNKNTPCAVYDMWGYSSIKGMPEITDLYPITNAEYCDRISNYRNQYFDTDTNTLKDYVPPPVAPTLDSRMAELEALCQQHMTSGIYFTPSAYTNPSLFDTGAASQSKMLTSFVASSNGLWPTTAVWKIDDGSFVNMTATDVINLAKKSQAYIQACYATEADLQTKLQADLTTDITVGWPSNK